MKKTIPICFYPMRKIIVDDDKDFLQSILFKLHDNTLQAYSSPREILDYLLYEYSPVFSKSVLIASDYSVENSRTQYSLNINIKKLRKMLTLTQQRDITVLLIDYHMPEISGLNFLKEIAHLPIKKALITAEKDLSIAIEAFNKGLIDGYIRKNEIDFSKKIQKLVYELEWSYFLELSSIITDVPELKYFENNSFICCFKNFIETNNITSFCLIDMQGSFIIKNNKNEYYYLILRTKDQLQELAKIAREDGAPSEIIKNLEKSNVIPFFSEKEHWEIPAAEWDKYFFPIEINFEKTDVFGVTIKCYLENLEIA